MWNKTQVQKRQTKYRHRIASAILCVTMLFGSTTFSFASSDPNIITPMDGIQILTTPYQGTSIVYENGTAKCQNTNGRFIWQTETKDQSKAFCIGWKNSDKPLGTNLLYIPADAQTNAPISYTSGSVRGILTYDNSKDDDDIIYVYCPTGLPYITTTNYLTKAIYTGTNPTVKTDVIYSKFTDDVNGFISALNNYQEEINGNGISGITNPTFTVGAGYALYLECKENKPLSIQLTTDTNGYQDGKKLFSAYYNTGAKDTWSNNVKVSMNGSFPQINWTNRDKATLFSTAHSFYYNVDMSASSNYNYYILVNPPYDTNKMVSSQSGKVPPITVTVVGKVDRAVKLKVSQDTFTDEVTTADGGIVYIDNNGELEEHTYENGSIDVEEDNIQITKSEVGTVTTEDDPSETDTSLISGLSNLLNKGSETGESIRQQFANFFSQFTQIYSWLPTDLYITIVGVFSLVLAIYVIKLFR